MSGRDDWLGRLVSQIYQLIMQEEHIEAEYIVETALRTVRQEALEEAKRAACHLKDRYINIPNVLIAIDDVTAAIRALAKEPGK